MPAQEKYRVTRKLDSGGMAEVYEGVAEGLQGFRKKVAIKRVLPHLVENKKFIAMFLDEARISLHLSHANVVQVFDIGQAMDTYFIVMEFVDGTNLKRFLGSLREQGRELPVEQAVFIAMEMCRGLSYAHSLRDADNRPLNLVHRDVSPPNVLLSRQGEVKIVDFGLAKATSQLEHTAPGVVKGKYAYLCPESATGNKVDHRMDVFCTGIVLWEMLTGQRLFLGVNDVETIKNVRNANVPSVCKLNPQVKPSLDAIVHKALAKEPDDRFQSCDELAEAMAHYLFAEQLKVTGFDLRRTLETVLSEKSERPSLLDNIIMEEISVFASLDGTRAAEFDRERTGGQPLLVSGFGDLSPSPARGAKMSAAAPDSVAPSLESMLEGGGDGEYISASVAAEMRSNFILGLVLAVSVVGVGFVAAWMLGLIP